MTAGRADQRSIHQPDGTTARPAHSTYNRVDAESSASNALSVQENGNRQSFVVHLDPKIHARAKLYCGDHRIRMKEWVESLIMRELQPPPKKLERLSDEKLRPDPWTLPPFWHGRK